MAKIGTVLFQAVSIFFSFKIGFQNKFYFVILRNQYLSPLRKVGALINPC